MSSTFNIYAFFGRSNITEKRIGEEFAVCFGKDHKHRIPVATKLRGHFWALYIASDAWGAISLQVGFPASPVLPAARLNQLQRQSSRIIVVLQNCAAGCFLRRKWQWRWPWGLRGLKRKKTRGRENRNNEKEKRSRRAWHTRCRGGYKLWRNLGLGFCCRCSRCPRLGPPARTPRSWVKCKGKVADYRPNLKAVSVRCFLGRICCSNLATLMPVLKASS